MLTAELWARCKAVTPTKQQSFWIVPSRFTLLDGNLFWNEVNITADLKLVDDKEIKELPLPKKEVLVGRYPDS